MIRETYYSLNAIKAKKTETGWGTGNEPKGDIIFLMRKPPHENHMYQNISVLAPSSDLLQDWLNRTKKGSNSYRMTWQDYTRRFLQEMDHPEAQAEIKRLAEQSYDKNIWLVCACFNDRKECHRFLVLDLIRQAGGVVAYGDMMIV